MMLLPSSYPGKTTISCQVGKCSVFNLCRTQQPGLWHWQRTENASNLSWKKNPLASCEGSNWSQDSFIGVQLLQWRSFTISSRADSSLWTTTISSIVFWVSPSYYKCRWKSYQKAACLQGFLQLYPPDPGMPSLRRRENPSLLHLQFCKKLKPHWFENKWVYHHPSLRPFLCLCFPLRLTRCAPRVWLSMDVLALCNLTISSSSSSISQWWLCSDINENAQNVSMLVR